MYIMAAVVAALDNYTPTQYGENGHLEFGESNNSEEKIVQLFFQLTRCDKSTMVKLATQYKDLLYEALRTNHKVNLSILYRLLLQTRDIVNGKGEYAISWHLINALDKMGLDVLARKIIYYSVKELPKDNGNMAVHPYGSWKDIKYLWTNFKWTEKTSQFMIDLVNNQLRQDLIYLNQQEYSKISLCGKWVPREKSQFSEMFKELAKNWYSIYIETAKAGGAYSHERVKRATRKCYTNYRKIISRLNRVLDTTQIKQCANNYSDINYDTVTSITMNRQRKAFENKNKNGSIRSNTSDRVNAATNFENWLNNKIKNNETVKGSRVGVNDYVKSALSIIGGRYAHDTIGTNNTETALINSQWADGRSSIGNLNNLVAMCDTSGSMEEDEALNSAIGLSIRVAEKSNIGKGRVMTFTDKPSWIKLGEGEYDFVDNVKAIINGPVGYNTNFTAALNLLLNACVEANCSEEEVGKLTLVIFSDMQIDFSGNESLSRSMWDHIKDKFREKGYNLVPHILFWNLRSTNGFPTLSTQPGCTMFSGFSPSLLNIFCEKGINGLREITPWKMLMEVLDNPRYKSFENWQLQ